MMRRGRGNLGREEGRSKEMSKGNKIPNDSLFDVGNRGSQEFSWKTPGSTPPAAVFFFFLLQRENQEEKKWIDLFEVKMI